MKKVATRQSFGEALAHYGELYPQVVCFDADLSKSTMSQYFAKKYPQRFFEMGIQEANMIGCAAGMSFAGKIPFICSFGAFLTGRFDQIRMSIGYSQANVKMIGTHSGVGIGDDGHSQMGLEDCALMRTIPGMVVLQPATDQETWQMMKWAIEYQGPVYLRLTRQALPDFPQAPFAIGVYPQHRQGKEVAMVASGALLAPVLEAAEILKNQNKADSSVYNGSTLKPLNDEMMQRLIGYEQIVVFEDHSVIGGLGSALSEWFSAQKKRPQIIRYGVQDQFGESGLPEDLYKKHGFTAQAIADKFFN